MKAHSYSSLAAGLCASLLGCTSTETGNPHSPKQPDDTTPFAETTPINLGIGLRSAAGGPAIVGINAEISELYLQVSEVEMITCGGESTASDNLATPSSYGAQQSVTVDAPEEDVCAIAVRTQPLSQNSDASLPPEGVGQGALLKGVSENGIPFTAIIPNRIFALLEPPSGLRLDELSNLSLQIDDTFLLEALTAEQPGSAVNGMDAVYDVTNTPNTVSLLEAQFTRAFSLVTSADTGVTTLAQSTVTVEQSVDLICASDCSLVDRSSCVTGSCDQSACVAMATDSTCGDLFVELLACRLTMSPSEFTCGPDETYSTDSLCAPEREAWDVCRRGNP